MNRHRVKRSQTRLSPQNGIVQVAGNLIDHQQPHWSIVETDRFVPLSYRFDDEVGGPVNAALAGLRVGNAKRAGRDIRASRKRMLVLGQRGVRCDIVGRDHDPRVGRGQYDWETSRREGCGQDRRHENRDRRFVRFRRLSCCTNKGQSCSETAAALTRRPFAVDCIALLESRHSHQCLPTALVQRQTIRALVGGTGAVNVSAANLAVIALTVVIVRSIRYLC
jgi:hypothetical protein